MSFLKTGMVHINVMKLHFKIFLEWLCGVVTKKGHSYIYKVNSFELHIFPTTHKFHRRPHWGYSIWNLFCGHPVYMPALVIWSIFIFASWKKQCAMCIVYRASCIVPGGRMSLAMLIDIMHKDYIRKLTISVPCDSFGV